MRRGYRSFSTTVAKAQMPKKQLKKNIEAWVIDIVAEGLGLTDIEKLKMFGGSLIATQTGTKSQGKHRDIQFTFNDYSDGVCFSFNVPLMEARPFIIFPNSHETEDGHISFTNAPIHVLTPVQCCFCWRPDMFHAGAANETGKIQVNPRPQLKPWLALLARIFEKYLIASWIVGGFLCARQTCTAHTTDSRRRS